MVSIRFSRTGKKNQPYFRIIALDKRKDPWGDYLENLGSYDPRKKTAQLKVDRIKHWMALGAQPTDSVWNLLVREKAIDAPKRALSNRKRAGVKEVTTVPSK